MTHVAAPVWHRFDLDGVTLCWTAFRSQERSGKGPWTPIEFLMVARDPEGRPAAGQTLPVGTVVTEEHARELVALMKSEGREV
jgi:hypothetical protein